jgi:predicted O-methyltransferase YrrM
MSLLSKLRALLPNRPAPAPAPPAPPPADAPWVPNGHFYSPIFDKEEVRRNEARLWPEHPVVRGIDFNDEAHRELLTRAFPAYIGDYDYPDTLEPGAEPTRYFNHNPQFGVLDSRALFVMLRDMRPKRVIEVGSGYSSLLMADVNRRFLGGETDITCIEPYPPAFLRQGVDGISGLIEKKVQEVPVEAFGRLDAGDILFIDSSHVSKIGSDVNYLCFEVLPALRAGVRVHIHDVLLPAEYPKQWILGEGRNWNEQYVVRALLMYSRAFRVFFSSTYAPYRFPGLVEAALRLAPGSAYGGSSLWLDVLPHD